MAEELSGENLAKTVLVRAGSIALWMAVYLLLCIGVMALIALLNKPLYEVCTDLNLPGWFCGSGRTWTFHDGIQHLRQSHTSTKVFLFLLWLIGGIWMDRDSW